MSAVSRVSREIEYPQIVLEDEVALNKEMQKIKHLLMDRFAGVPPRLELMGGSLVILNKRDDQGVPCLCLEDKRIQEKKKDPFALIYLVQKTIREEIPSRGVLSDAPQSQVSKQASALKIDLERPKNRKK